MTRAFLAFVLLILAFGCISQSNENLTNKTNETKTNITPPVSPPPAQEISSGNITESPTPPLPVNTTNQTNQTNQTAPEVPPEPEKKGLAFGGGRYLLVLDDASLVPTSEEPCGIFSIRLASDYSVLDKTIICPGESDTWFDEAGHGYRIFVVKVAAGYSGSGSWADVRIYG
jgi:hypothetical protein